MATTTPISVRFQDEVREQLDQFANLTNRSRNYIVNEAVAAYTKEQLTYMDEINAAVEEAKSGVGHSSEQIFEWLRSMGTENELPKPQPDILPDRS